MLQHILANQQMCARNCFGRVKLLKANLRGTKHSLISFNNHWSNIYSKIVDICPIYETRELPVATTKVDHGRNAIGSH